MELMQNITYLWLIAGAALIVLEFLALPGVGLFFAGLGALTVGLLLEINLITGPIWPWTIFFGATLAWVLVLWKPLKNFRTNKSEAPFLDVVGQKARLITALAPGETGKAKWSGTIMNAQLEPSIQNILTEGSEVVIVAIQGNILIVR